MKILQTLSFLDKKVNRISRLNRYRRVNCLTTQDTVGGFEIEISPKAIEKLKKLGKDLSFSFEHDFGIEDKERGMYWVRVENEYSTKRTDFTYFATGSIRPRQHSGMDDWGVQVRFNHIDAACNWGQLNALCEILAKWVDINYGNDCGFEDRWRVGSMNIDFIKNKK